MGLRGAKIKDFWDRYLIIVPETLENNDYL